MGEVTTATVCTPFPSYDDVDESCGYPFHCVMGLISPDLVLTYITEAGHLSRDCPEPPKSKACYRCGETGHLSRECPQQEGAGGPPQGGGMRSAGSDCYKCTSYNIFCLI